jgi:23S rRNA-/tRNA-specific pseudouridylate synthase
LSPNYDETTKEILKKPSKDSKERKLAITKYRVLDSNNSSALIELQPITGFIFERKNNLYL